MDLVLAKYLTRDLYTYCEDGMGFRLFEDPHRLMSDEFEAMLPPPPDLMRDSEQKYSAYGAPRETLKTSIGAQGLAEYFLLKWKVHYNYDGRVLLVRSAREAANTVLLAVREDLSTSNAVLQRAFGVLGPADSPLWTTEAITLNWRSTVYREASLESASPGVSKTGFHYDMVICDDLANETNYHSEVEMEKAWRYIQALMPVMNAWGSMVVIGTRWGHNDPHGKIIALNEIAYNNQEEPIWKVSIHGAYNDDGTLFYPSYLTDKKLDQKRRAMDEKMYRAQYLNVVMTDESRIFKPDDLRYYDGIYYPKDDGPAEIEFTEGWLAGERRQVSCNIHVDPATSVAQGANSTGINVVCMDGEGNRFVELSLKTKEMPSETIKRIVALANHYQPDTISIDVLGQQVLWVDLLKSALRQNGLGHITITQYKGKDGKVGRGILGKARRIEQGLEPLLRARKIYAKRGMCQPLLKEIQYYEGVTGKEHYDVLDSLAHTTTVGRPPLSEVQQSQVKEDLEYREEFEDELREKRLVRGGWAGR